MSFLKMCDNTFGDTRNQDIQIRKCEWSQGYQMTQTKTRVKGQWGGVGPWVKGGKGLGHGGDSDISLKYS